MALNMELVETQITKTYKVPFFETFDFAATKDCIQSILVSMPEYSLVKYKYDYDELAFYITVRKSQ